MSELEHRIFYRRSSTGNELRYKTMRDGKTYSFLRWFSWTLSLKNYSKKFCIYLPVTTVKVLFVFTIFLEIKEMEY